MNQEIKKQWLGALRSGEYLQGKGSLREHNHYCCLGVLCDLHRQAGKGEWNDIPESEKYMYFRKDAFLPHEVIKWAELNSVDPDIEFDGEFRELSDLNDGGYTFEQIADLIEEQL